MGKSAVTRGVRPAVVNVRGIYAAEELRGRELSIQKSVARRSGGLSASNNVKFKKLFDRHIDDRFVEAKQWTMYKFKNALLDFLIRMREEKREDFTVGEYVEAHMGEFAELLSSVRIKGMRNAGDKEKVRQLTVMLGTMLNAYKSFEEIPVISDVVPEIKNSEKLDTCTVEIELEEKRTIHWRNVVAIAYIVLVLGILWMYIDHLRR